MRRSKGVGQARTWLHSRLEGRKGQKRRRAGRGFCHQRPSPRIPAHDRGGRVEARAFDVVVVHSFSRFFRDHFELEFYVRKLAKNGVKLLSITQEMGDDPMHVMMRQIMALFDEYQSKGERQARPAGAEGKCAARLLERRAAADRLSHHRGRDARGQGQEEAGNRSAARRHHPPDLPPCAGRSQRLRSDGGQGHRQPLERAARLHPRAIAIRLLDQGAATMSRIAHSSDAARGIRSISWAADHCIPEMEAR